MTGTETTILVVEDDEAIANGLALNMKLEGFRPIVVHDGEAGLRAVDAHRPGLILLDISLPKKNGLEVLSTLREAGDLTPVIVLSARQNEFDKVSALRLGADDYVTKPFGVAELFARVQAVLRRFASAASPSRDREPERILRFADVEVDLATRQVHRGGEPVPMTNLEFELLVFLIENPDRVFTREQLLHHVWGVQHTGSPRTVDNFIGQLRAKLEETPNQPAHIVTVRSRGYRFIRGAD